MKIILYVTAAYAEKLLQAEAEVENATELSDNLIAIVTGFNNGTIKQTESGQTYSIITTK